MHGRVKVLWLTWDLAFCAKFAESWMYGRNVPYCECYTSLSLMETFLMPAVWHFRRNRKRKTDGLAAATSLLDASFGAFAVRSIRRE